MWLVTASAFHLANLLLLNIPFDLHIPVYLLFLSGALPPLRWPGYRTAAWGRALVVLAGALHLVLRAAGLAAETLFVPVAYLGYTPFLYLCVLLWVAVIGLGLTDIRRTRASSDTLPTI